MAQELDENFKSVSEEVQSEISFRIIFFLFGYCLYLSRSLFFCYSAIYFGTLVWLEFVT